MCEPPRAALLFSPPAPPFISGAQYIYAIHHTLVLTTHIDTHPQGYYTQTIHHNEQGGDRFGRHGPAFGLWVTTEICLVSRDETLPPEHR